MNGTDGSQHNNVCFNNSFPIPCTLRKHINALFFKTVGLQSVSEAAKCHKTAAVKLLMTKNGMFFWQFQIITLNLQTKRCNVKRKLNVFFFYYMNNSTNTLRYECVVMQEKQREKERLAHFTCTADHSKTGKSNKVGKAAFKCHLFQPNCQGYN